jgi:nitrogen fixation NifU-like protein
MIDDVADLYQDTILRHARQPLHMRDITAPDASASGDNPMCGDRCTVSIKYAPDETLADIVFKARGCAISLASADLMAETLRHRTPGAARALADDFKVLVKTGQTTNPDLATLRPLSGVAEYPSRIKCATLPWAALLAALDGRKEATSE